MNITLTHIKLLLIIYIVLPFRQINLFEDTFWGILMNFFSKTIYEIRDNIQWLVHQNLLYINLQ